MSKPSTILIVDDDPVVIEHLTAHFRRRNFEPIATANPTIVKQILEGFKVHLILLDLRMERVNGYDILKELRAQNIDTPVLIITAYYQNEKERLSKLGIQASDVIEKPIHDLAMLESKINSKLNRVILPGQVESPYELSIYEGNRTVLLLVDDEEELNEILKETFESRNYDVKVFSRGDTAFKFIQNNECHVAIVDIKIPGLSGEQLIKQALAVKPNLKIVPISAAYPKEMKDLLNTVGFNPSSLVTKPFDLTQLVEQVKVYAAESGTLNNS